MYEDKVMNPDDGNEEDDNAVMSAKIKVPENNSRMPSVKNGYGNRTDPNEPNHMEDFRYREHR